MRHAEHHMKRRDFITAGLTAVAAGAATSISVPAHAAAPPAAGGKKFTLKIAPKLDMFKAHVGKDAIENLKFMADQGFTAFYHLGLAGMENAPQIMKEAERLGMAAGPFSGGVSGLLKDDDESRQGALTSMKKAVDNAKRLNVECMLVVPGKLIAGMTMEQMTANVVKNLKYLVEKVDFGDKKIVLEPLNPRNHPGMFLTKIRQSVEICKAVGSPSIKIVNDLYHQQITEGDLIPNIEFAWDYIGSYHLGDNPGRKEPLTGEINFRNVFKFIHHKGYRGVLCMEHGLSVAGIEGEKKLIAAYRWCDAIDEPIA
jgi:hydroxypyruvate isomerase